VSGIKIEFNVYIFILYTVYIIMVGMEKALVLINLGSSEGGSVIKRIKSHSKVLDAKMIYGPYDIYAICENNNTAGTRRTVLELRNIEGVISTVTCPIMKME